MKTYEAVIIVLIIVVIVALAVRGRQTGLGFVGEAKVVGGKLEKRVSSLISGTGPQGQQDYQNFAALGQETAAENARILNRTGVPNYAAGFGSSRPPHPHDVATRNGSYISPERVAEAERNAWAPYSATATPHYDVRKGTYAGNDLVQQMGHYQEGDWAQQLSDLALDPRTREQHNQWVDEVGPFSQTAFSVDNLDEAVAMAQPRQGITAFRSLAPAQSSSSLFVTELGPDDHAEHFKPFYF